MFLGINGSGETTTIRMLCGLLKPDSGWAQCLGYNIIRQPNEIRHQVNYMTQRFSLMRTTCSKSRLCRARLQMAASSGQEPRPASQYQLNAS